MGMKGLREEQERRVSCGIEDDQGATADVTGAMTLCIVGVWLIELSSNGAEVVPQGVKSCHFHVIGQCRVRMALW